MLLFVVVPAYRTAMRVIQFDHDGCEQTVSGLKRLISFNIDKYLNLLYYLLIVVLK